MLKEFDNENIENYFNQKYFKHKRTEESYRRSLQKFIDYTNKEDLTSSNFRKDTFFETLQKFSEESSFKYEISTVNFIVKVVMNFFLYLIQIGVIDDFNISLDNKILENELDMVELKCIIPYSEFEKLEKYALNKKSYIDLFMFYISFYCGLKTQHICNLKYSDFITDYDGYFYYINSIFEKKPPIYIKLPEKVKSVFLKIQPSKKRIYIFVDSKGEKDYQRHINRVFKRYCKDAGINYYTPKDFRHSSIYYFVIENGADADVLCSRYNWSNDNLKRMYEKLPGIKDAIEISKLANERSS